MKKVGVICFVMIIFAGYSGEMMVRSFDTILDENLIVISDRGGFPNQTSIPSWTINDTWIYEGDVYFVGENLTFDGAVNNVAQSVVEVVDITTNDTIPYYAIEINGEIDGILTYDWISGDLEGVIYGWMHVRVSDLALMEIEMWSNGTIDVWPLTFNYGLSSPTIFTPPLENYDFPVVLGETWGIFSNISADVMFNIGDIVNENFSESGMMNEMMTCDNKDNITVPGGIFEAFQIDVHGNEALTYWYSPMVKNSIKTLVNFTSENSTLDLQMNLTSYSLTNQLINITQFLMPSSTFANDPVNITGHVSDYSSGIPIPNASVLVRLPYTNQIFETPTDNTGNYSLSIVAPLVRDSTPTSVDFGSDGIIVVASRGNLSGYTIQTLTVDGLKHTFLFSTGWNLITVPTDSNLTAETLGENITHSSVISKFNGETQVFSTHVVGTPWDDFPIENGTGYFIFMMNANNFTVRDIPITSVSIPIFLGWNIIGWYQYFNTTAEDLGHSITNCSVVIMFNEITQTFISHVVGTPWDNFMIKQGMGLFIWSNAEGWWQGDK